MNPSPAISIVVPFYKSEATLGPCIESLLAQDLAAPYEILLIDNRSPDTSPTIARRYADQGRLTLLDEDTPGAYAARNTGIRHASAPIIALTDADCVVDRDWLTAIVDGMADPETAVLVGHCRYPANASWSLRLLAAYENAKSRYVIERCPPANHFAYANNMAVRRSVFSQIGPFETWPRAADSELVHRLAARRPDLRLRYHPSMRIDHLEFVRGRNRAQRLKLYQSTNARIPTFRELSLWQRLAVVRSMLLG